MKIIDLLNKIANGEEVPKKIKYQNYEYEFNKLDKEYQRWSNGLNYGLGEDKRLDIILDDEVEIIEGEKKIPEKIPLNYADDREPEEVYEYLRCSYNQLIDYLKSKGE